MRCWKYTKLFYFKSSLSLFYRQIIFINWVLLQNEGTPPKGGTNGQDANQNDAQNREQNHGECDKQIIQLCEWINMIYMTY